MSTEEQNQALSPSPFADGAAREPGLQELVATLLDGRWLIAGVTTLALAIGALHAWLGTPIYLSDVLLQVETRNQGGILDKPLAPLLAVPTPAETELEILRSRSLLGSVVDELGLDVVAEPLYLPLVGAALARGHKGSELARPLWGLGSYAWGGEHIAIRRLSVAPRFLGGGLELTALEEGRFELRGPAGEALLRGEVGKDAASSDRSVELLVSALRARPGTRFRLGQLPRDGVVRSLQAGLAVREKAKMSGILLVALEGENPARIAAILDATAKAYVRQNVERRSQEAEKTLEFLRDQLPTLKSDLESAEGALKTYQTQTGTVDLSLETKAALERAVDVEKLLAALAVQRAELRLRFTDSHPTLMALERRMGQLKTERGDIESRIKQLPDAELRSARLLRDVKVDNELYLLLLNKAQELRVLKSGTIGDVRILDSALVPRWPERPSRRTSLAFSLVTGLALGLALAFARKALDRGVEDPDLIEQTTGLSVYASVPHSAKQAEQSRVLRRRKGKNLAVLAATESNELAVESIRSLRTSLQFALVEARNNVVAIGGPSPGVGKSFVAVNLAHVLGDAGRRVLLIDGDLRKGKLHHYFGFERSPGLTDLIAETSPPSEAIRACTSPKVHFLPTGQVPPNPSELLGGERFRRFIEAVSRQYDLVLIDAPPILAVTDAALIGTVAGVNLLVLRSGKHPLREISFALKRFAQSGVKAQGVVLNDVLSRPGRRYAGNYYYPYEYR